MIKNTTNHSTENLIFILIIFDKIFEFQYYYPKILTVYNNLYIALTLTKKLLSKGILINISFFIE